MNSKPKVEHLPWKANKNKTSNGTKKSGGWVEGLKVVLRIAYSNQK